MKYLLLLLLASTARAAPLIQPQDIAPPTMQDFFKGANTVSSVTFIVPAGSVDFASATWSLDYNFVSTNTVHCYVTFNNTISAIFNNNTCGKVNATAPTCLQQTEYSCLLDYGAGGVLSAASTPFVGTFRFRTAHGSNKRILADNLSDIGNFNSNTPSGGWNNCDVTLAAVPTSVEIYCSTVGDASSTPNTVGSIGEGHFEISRGYVHQ